MIFPPPGWTWPNVITAAIGLTALGLSIANTVEQVRYRPRPTWISDWGRGDVMPSEVNYAPCATLWLRNHGDSVARDVQAFVSTLPDRDGAASSESGMVEPGDSLGPVTVPLTRQTRFEMNLDSNLHFGYVLTVAPEEVVYERPTVTIRWRQAPYGKKPRTMQVQVPGRLLGPAEF